MQSLAREEHVVFRALADGLRALPGVRIYEPSADCPRHPTIAFTVAGRAADDVAAELGSKAAVFLSHGNFYAATAVAKVAPESLARGGVLRAGVAAYTTQDEVERLLAAVAGVRA
jgi:selenocysteine lyase/cysteine desulfurase